MSSGAILHFTADDLRAEIYRKSLSLWITSHRSGAQLGLTTASNQDLVSKPTGARETKPRGKFDQQDGGATNKFLATGCVKYTVNSLLCAFSADLKLFHGLFWFRQPLAV